MPPGLGNLIALEPVHSAFVSKEKDMVVGGSDEQGLHKVLLPRAQPHDPLAAALLASVGIGWLAFDIAEMGEGDNGFLFLNQVFQVDVIHRRHKLCTALVPKFFLNLEQLIFDDAAQQLLIRQYLLIVSHIFHQFVVFFFDLFTLDAGQTSQTHIQNRLRLQVAQSDLLHQVLFRIVITAANNMNYTVDIIQRNPEAFQDVDTGQRLIQIVLGTPCYNFLLKFDIFLQHLFEAKNFRFLVYNCQHINTEGFLQLGIFIKLV